MIFRKFPIGQNPPEPASSEEIASCENRHGIQLPKSLTVLLKLQNGGELKKPILNEPLFNNIHQVSIISDPTSPFWEPQIASLFDWLLYRGELTSANDSIPELEEKAGNIKRLISISGTGTYHFLLDYRNNKINPKIYFLDLVVGDGDLRYICDDLNDILPAP